MNLNDGISLEEKELLRTQMSDYYSFAFPEFDMKSVFENEPVRAKASNKNIKIAIEVPPIELSAKSKPEVPAAAPVTPAKPVAAPSPQPAKPTAPAAQLQAAQPSPAPAVPTTPKPVQAPAAAAPQPKPEMNVPKPAVQPMVPPPPQVTKQDLETVNQKLSEIYKIMDGYVSSGDLEDFENRVSKIFNSSVETMENKLESFKKTVVPSRKQYESDTLFKKNLYDAVCQMLDELLVPLFERVPDYNLLSFQNTEYNKDGSVSNALVSINSTVDNGDYSYTFKIDVPILGGIINAPTFISRGNKIIPLLKANIQKEITTFSYVKAPQIDDQEGRDNLYNANPDRMYHKEDNQTQYHTVNQPFISVNPGGKFRKDMIERNSDDNFNSTVNSPKYFPKF